MEKGWRAAFSPGGKGRRQHARGRCWGPSKPRGRRRHQVLLLLVVLQVHPSGLLMAAPFFATIPPPGGDRREEAGERQGKKMGG